MHLSLRAAGVMLALVLHGQQVGLADSPRHVPAQDQHRDELTWCLASRPANSLTG